MSGGDERMSMDVSGFEDVYRALAQLGVRANAVANKALREGAKPIADAMRENVNISARHEVHVRDDIAIGNVKTDSDGVKTISIGPTAKTAWRAKFLEYGTSKMPAYPFMQPAADEQRKAAYEAIRNVVKGAIT